MEINNDVTCIRMHIHTVTLTSIKIMFKSSYNPLLFLHSNLFQIFTFLFLILFLATPKL